MATPIGFAHDEDMGREIGILLLLLSRDSSASSTEYSSRFLEADRSRGSLDKVAERKVRSSTSCVLVVISGSLARRCSLSRPSWTALKE